MDILQDMSVPLTLSGDGLHDEVGIALLMSRKWSSDETDKREVEIRRCEVILSCSGKDDCGAESAGSDEGK